MAAHSEAEDAAVEDVGVEDVADVEDAAEEREEATETASGRRGVCNFNNSPASTEEP